MTNVNLVFSGQGSQFVGMGHDFYESNQHSSDLFNRANDVLGYDLASICFQGPESTLNQTQHTQVAIFVVSACIFNAIKSSLSIAGIAGHSLGEITAYYASGVLDFESALQIVIKRGELMAQAADQTRGKMAAVIGLSESEVSAQLAGIHQVRIANYNSPVQFVISGEASGIDTAIQNCTAAGAKRVVELPVSGAFHSPLMASAVPPFQDMLNTISFHNATIPIVLNRFAQPESNGDALKTNLSEQIQSPVRWIETIDYLSQSSSSFVEVGPGKVLSGLIKKINRDYSVQFTSTLAHVDETFGVEMNEL